LYLAGPLKICCSIPWLVKLGLIRLNLKFGMIARFIVKLVRILRAPPSNWVQVMAMESHPQHSFAFTTRFNALFDFESQWIYNSTINRYQSRVAFPCYTLTNLTWFSDSLYNGDKLHHNAKRSLHQAILPRTYEPIKTNCT
jgi:hypothetical protein